MPRSRIRAARHGEHGLSRPGPLRYLAAAAVLLGCRGDGTAGSDASTSTTAVATSTTAAVDPSRPQTATGANGNPRDERIGPPANNRPSDGTLGEGACFNEFLIPQGEVLLHTTEVLDCAAAHDGEVFAVLALPPGPTDPFPGETEVAQLAAGLCLARFEPFVGLEYATSRLRIAVLRPTGTTWAKGDRSVVCSVYDEDLEPLTGSARSSAR